MTTNQDHAWQILDDILVLLAKHHFPTPERTYKLDGGWGLAHSDLKRAFSKLTAERDDALARVAELQNTDIGQLYAMFDVIRAKADAAMARAEKAEADAAEAKNALMVSETYRRAYAKGKYALYAMGGDIGEAAMKHLPCSEGPLERYEMKVERENSPLLAEHNARLVELLKKAQLLSKALRDNLFDVLDRIGALSNHSELENMGFGPDRAKAMIDMAKADSNERQLDNAKAENTNLSRDDKQQVEAIVELAHKLGWNGVDNSKFLSDFLEGYIGDLQEAEELLDWLQAHLADVEYEPTSGTWRCFGFRRNNVREVLRAAKESSDAQ